MDYLQALDKAFAKVEYMSTKLTEFPHTTRQGQWLTHANGHWTGGFWTGLLWLSSFYSKNPNEVKAQALHWAKKFKSRINDNKTHDMGFIFGPSCVLGYRMTKDEELLEMAACGARNMTDLYKKEVGLILAWDEPGYEGCAIVDTIMNLPLMAWIAEQKQLSEYKEIACRVADQIFEQHVRKDFSVYHMVKWDPRTYKIVERTTHQGYAPETCWSRGQAWALYGFSNMYRYTKEKKYLEVSAGLAEYFWNHLDDQLYLPRWDFVFKNQTNEPLDSSAASVAASGMSLLSDLLAREGQSEKAMLWSTRSETIAKALIEHCLYSEMDRYGIIEKATVDKPRNSGVGESTMYGDYYFVEALFRILHRGNREMLDILY